jgi:hypothetical protein
LLGHILFVEFARKGVLDLVEPGEVARVLEDLRIRPTGSLTRAQVTELGDSLDVAYVMLGTVLESGTARTPDGDVPSVAVVLRLVEVSSGRIVWARFGGRTGDDREKVFGWGRVRSRERLAASVAAELFRDLQLPAAQGVAARTGARR